MQLSIDAQGFELPATKPAAKRAPRFAYESHSAVTLRVLQRGAGLTSHEAAANCRLTAREIGRRVAELVRQQLVEPVKDEDGQAIKRPTPSGRKAQAWRLAK